MANKEHLRILRQGVERWNQWRQQQPTIEPDLSGIDFREVAPNITLDGADFSKANLSGANLRGMILHGVNFHKARLREADLTEARLCDFAFEPPSCLTEAYLDEADLSRADLTRVNLSGASLMRATLAGATFFEAKLGGASLDGANLALANFEKANLKNSNLHSANLFRTNLTKAKLCGASLWEAILSSTVIVGANLANANLEGARVYGASVWDVQLERTNQKNLVITPPGQPIITVDNLEVAQFIYLLLNHKKLRDVINSVTVRGVLILGRFGGGGFEVLQSVAAKLREENYLPIIFDFDRPTGQNYTETVQTLVGLSRFVIVDLSGPSVPQELYATVPHFKIPFVPILEEGRKTYAMAADIFEYPWVIHPPLCFKSTEELIEKIPGNIITPAEEKLKERQALMDRLFSR